MHAEIAKMKQAHKVVAEFTFKPAKLEHGYAGRTLRIDLDTNEITEHPVDQKMKDLWIGGKGFDLWLMYQEMKKNGGVIKWEDPENPICFSPGPLAGSAEFPGSGKTLVTSISPLTDSIIDSNVGGYFGPYLKFTGYDALVLVGRAPEETVIYIDAPNNKITIERAPLESVDSHILAEELTEMYGEDDMDRRNVSVVSAGRAANHTRMGILNFSFYDWRREIPRLKQAGRGGIGTVFRKKNLKALVVRNKPLDPSWTVKDSKASKFFKPEEAKNCCKGEVEEVKAIAEKWEKNPEYAIEMMQDIQERFRHISEAAIDTLQKEIKTPKAYLYHIATFYKSFSLEKRGETTIQVCMGTACHVKGAAKLLDSFERVLEVKAGETTADKKYTLEAVACLGACSIAPVVKIGDEVHGNVQAKDCKKLLEDDQKKKEVNNA